MLKKLEVKLDGDKYFIKVEMKKKYSFSTQLNMNCYFFLDTRKKYRLHEQSMLDFLRLLFAYDDNLEEYPSFAVELKKEIEDFLFLDVKGLKL